MLLGTIWAQGHNRGIAVGHKLPWRIPEDFRFFKETVSNCPVLMGRVTWEACGRKPLPGCDTYVVTRNENYETPGATRCSTLDEALGKLRETQAPIAWILGGAHIYAETQKYCDICVITHVDMTPDNADVFAPQLDKDWETWVRSPQTGSWHTSTNGIRYRYEVLTRPGTAVPRGVLPTVPDASFFNTL
ncbi:dihydrofolate reductase [Actinotignum urinale]|uniref:dihydrofolate reductase n=1 Tax=Actinotignum urinale TaxID=190146 RepID=UPI002A80EA3F|nr:dihydrofolate reductase [Actinotignum urinale]MDY5151644.1 dihydrofolate reductase [Actinotignum urinale]